MANLRTVQKKISTKDEGVFYKEVVNENNKIVDKIFLIRYRENYADKQMTIGKFSEGIRLEFCKAKRIDILNKIRHGEFVSKQSKITFDDVFKKYIQWAEHNKKTWKQDANTFEFHLKEFKKYDLRQLKPEIFEKLKQEKLSDGYKPRTVQLILGLARQIINYAINNELILNYANPISKGKVKMPVYDNKQIGFLTKEQAKRLLKILKANPYPLTYRLTVLLLYSGARFSEVASLTWDDIDFNNRLIYFKSNKNGNDRKVYIPDVALEVLNDLYKEKTSNLVIPVNTRTLGHPYASTLGHLSAKKYSYAIVA